jgi:hypothetical protein
MRRVILSAVVLLAACSIPDDPVGPGAPLPPPEQPTDEPAPTPELSVAWVDVPMSARQGSVVAFNLKVHNGGRATARAGWYGRVYLSADNDIDAGDRLIAQFPAPRDLRPGQSDDYQRTFKLSRLVAPGRYHMLVELDIDRRLGETQVQDNFFRTRDMLLVQQELREPQ